MRSYRENRCGTVPTVLFVCEGNRARSPMAEAFFNAWAPAGWRGISGGTSPKASVHPAAIALMAEMGIDISHHKPKPIDLEAGAKAWRVVAMCSPDACPIPLRDTMVYWAVADPADVPEDRWPEIRDEIAERVKALLREIARTAIGKS